MTAPGAAVQRRRSAERRGRRSEFAALALLAVKGFRPLARRWRSPVGELDLVVVRGNLLTFVEVKARASESSGLEAITAAQQKRMAAAAQAWLASNPAYARYNMRFDAVIVTPRRLPRHLPDAFRPHA
ncbi:YraN family protein [Tepidamorphus sp. 3E244]|uniref:YraN family protein n=1 Tax=Tepidamorphus sp. 3E244 TaxID=3385498 RepID=UPI0038FD3E30